MGKHTSLINRLWSTADRKVAESFANHFGEMAGMDDRIPALLTEASKPTDMTPDQSWDYLRGFTESIGTPPHAMAAFGGWFGTAAAEVAAAEAPPAAEQSPAAPDQAPAPTAPPPVAATPRFPVGPPREQLLEQNAQHLRNMRAEVGSPDWRAYHKDGGSAQYLANLQALETLNAVPPAPQTLAGGAAAPAPAAEPPAPGA
jgi:hypothetical protein